MNQKVRIVKKNTQIYKKIEKGIEHNKYYQSYSKLLKVTVFRNGLKGSQELQKSFKHEDRNKKI
jgi:hypothetical protein